MSKPISEQLFNRFWKAYPRRNNKKVGKYPCSLWFEAKNPSPAIVDIMIDWIEQDRANRETAGNAGNFYTPPCDPIRFLKEQMWGDDIGHIDTDSERADKLRTESRKQAIDGWKKSLNLWIFNPITPIGRVLKDSEFKRACEAFPEIKAWAIEQRPELKVTAPRPVLSQAAQEFKDEMAERLRNSTGSPTTRKDLSLVRVSRDNPPTDKAAVTTGAGGSVLPAQIDTTQDLPPPNKFIALFRDVEVYRDDNPERFKNLT